MKNEVCKKCGISVDDYLTVDDEVIVFAGFCEDFLSEIEEKFYVCCSFRRV